MGLIAQDVLTAGIPEVVATDDEGYHYLAYDKLVALMNEGIKELNNKLEALTTRISALENI